LTGGGQISKNRRLSRDAMSYSFPLLSNGEILACLAELDIGLTDADLQKPTYESVRPAFEAIVMLLVGVTRCGGSSPKIA